MISQEEFEEKLVEFERLEPSRSQLYKMGLKMIQSDYKIEAYLLILATWNFARFRYFMRKFDLNNFRNIINNLEPIFERLKDEDFINTEWNVIAPDITEIYLKLKSIVGQTGASKIMHFRQPKLFIMWDTTIRARYYISTICTANDYLYFLQLMKSNFGHLRWNSYDRERTFAKAIDECNFALVHGDEDN